MALYNLLLRFSLSKWSWALMIALVSVCFSLSLYFQHIMELAPCVLCIYERLTLMGLWFVGVLGLMVRGKGWARGVVFGLWTFLSGLGFKIAYGHMVLQNNPSPFGVCSTKLSFSDIIPLDTWFPNLFKATGSCSSSLWDFVGITMVEWIVFIFSVSLTLALLFASVEVMSVIKKEGIYAKKH